MAGRQAGLFDVDERLQRLSDLGDRLGAYGKAVNFALFRPDLEAALAYGDGSKGGRPLFARFDQAVREAGYIPMAGQLVDASLVSVPKQRNSEAEKADIKAERTARANPKKSAVRARIEHVFAEQKERMELFVRTIGLARAELKIGMANLVDNIKRTLWLNRRAVPA